MSEAKAATFVPVKYNAEMVLVGIDFGSRRVGIAVSESGVLATPHSVISHRGDLEEVAERIATIARDLGAERFVMGLPRRPHGETPATFVHFAELLRTRTGLDVEMWDESYSTTEAASLRRDRRPRGRSRDPIDHEAAAVILQSYLDSKGVSQ